MELTFNEKDAAETDKDDNPNLYMLEGIVMNEPKGEWSDLKNNLAISL